MRQARASKQVLQRSIRTKRRRTGEKEEEAKVPRPSGKTQTPAKKFAPVKVNPIRDVKVSAETHEKIALKEKADRYKDLEKLRKKRKQ